MKHPNRPLALHIKDVIHIWYEHNKNNVTEEAVTALQETITYTIYNYKG